MKPKLGTCIDCDNSKQVPLIAKRCKMHYLKHRAKLKQGKDGKEFKPKQIKPVSDKRKEENKLYSAKRALFLAENTVCPITGKEATEIHHTYAGANRSAYFLDETTWLAVSRIGHIWIHEHPKEAKEKGYLK